MKRAFDIIASGLGLLFLSPLFIILAIWIKSDSKGPVFYKQVRVGRYNKDFYLYKFRSMYLDSDKKGLITIGNKDPRVTKSGYFIRKYKLDEFPQLINVFKGDMSLVGPRPEREVFYNEFEKYIHGFSERLKVKPGLTGWAQINGGYNLRPEEKVVYDVEYIKNRSIGFDLKIIFMDICFHLQAI